MARAQHSVNDPYRPKMAGGVGRLRVGNTVLDLDPNAEVRGTSWYGTPYAMGISRQMLRDTHVRKGVDAIRDPLLGATWDFEPRPSDRDNALAEQVADFCRFCFFECNPWQSVLRNSLSYLFDGWTVLEPTDDVVPISRDRFPASVMGDVGVVFTGLHHRPGWTFDADGFEANDENPLQLAALYQENRQRKLDRFIRLTWEQNADDYTGMPLTRSIYWAYKAKKVLQLVEIMRHEREHMGVPTIKLPEGATPDMEAEARKIAADIRANSRGYLVLPDGFDFEWSNTTTSTDINATIERLNRDIAHLFGNGFTLLGSRGTSGSNALSETQMKAYMLSIDQHANFVSECFSRGQDGWSAVEHIVRLNFGDQAPVPQLVARNLPTRNYLESFTVLHNLLMSGGARADVPLRKTIREVMYLPPEDPNTLEPVPFVDKRMEGAEEKEAEET